MNDDDELKQAITVMKGVSDILGNMTDDKGNIKHGCQKLIKDADTIIWEFVNEYYEYLG